MKNRVCFVGPLPPPVGGFAEINNRMHKLLAVRCDLRTFDMAPRHYHAVITQLARFAITAIFSRPNKVYIGLSGGLRQFIDLFFVLMARLASARITIHHHSFAYLRARRWYTNMLFKVGGGQMVHVALCEDMAGLLNKHYGIEPEQLVALSNVAFLDASAREATKGREGGIVLGFLSHVTAEKGVFHFLDVCQRASENGIELSGIIAGPIDRGIEEAVKSRLSGLPNVRHIGPVYGADKDEFYQSLDFFVFPSSYSNEAEPVVLWEAMSYGIVCLSTDIGCTSCIIPSAVCETFDTPQSMVATISDAQFLPGLMARRGELREAVSKHFIDSKKASSKVLADLVESIG